MLNLIERTLKYFAAPRSNLHNGKRKEISYSRISTFKRCPKQHYYHYIKHLKGKKSSSNLLFGKSVHAALAYFYESDMNVPLDSFLESFEGNIRQEEENSEVEIAYKEGESLETLIEYGKMMLTGYYEKYAKEDKEKYEVLAVETPFWIPLFNRNGRVNQKYMLTGIIDLILKDKNTGDVIIVDHKTLSRRMTEGTEENTDQVSLYYLGALSLGMMPTAVCYNNLYKYKEPQYERRFAKRDNRELNTFLEDANSVVKAISFGINHRNQGMVCHAMCDLKDYCLKHDEDSVFEYEPKTLKQKLEEEII